MTLARRSWSVLPPIIYPAAVFLVVAWITWASQTEDMDAFLRPWFAHIVHHGVIGAFATPFSNYNPPYLYLLAAASPLADWMHPVFAIKLVSYAGHAWLGVAIVGLLRCLSVHHPVRGAMLAMIAPTLLANPALFVQCDALWAAALVMAVTAAIGRRGAAMFLWCGVAVAFKLQAAFVAPFFLAVALSARMPLRVWLLAPAAYLALLLPAWAAGWPLGDLLTIYLRQSEALPQLSMNAPNIWMIVNGLFAPPYPIARAIALAATLVAVAVYLLFFIPRLRDADGCALVRAALICALIVPALLPQMHERYFFMADVLAIALAMARPREWRLVLLTQCGSGLALLAYLWRIDTLSGEGALPMLAATWLAIRPLWYRPGSARIAGGQLAAA